MNALRVLLDQRLRLVLTVGGVALCVVLMLFLCAVYGGVRVGSVEYVRASDADLWVLQRHTTNILRGTSILPEAQGAALRALPGVASASPVLLFMAGIEGAAGTSTVYVVGFDPATGVGGPPELAEGRAPRAAGEIVLDRAFALASGLAVGDDVRMGEASLRVTGLSAGTNMFVIQYAFTTLAQAQALAGLPGTVSAWLAKIERGADAASLAASVRATSGAEAYDRATFVANNVREMESGFLPLLSAVAVLGGIVLTAILSLILSVHVLERRADFAAMKALGAPAFHVPRLVVRQALWIAGFGLGAALVLFWPLLALLEALSPVVEARATLLDVVGVAVGVAVIGLVSSLLPIHRVRRIYALEAFR